MPFRISDNGQGTDLDARRSGLGLLGMRERMEALGGQLEVRSAPARGFEAIARIPIRATAAVP